METKLTIKNLFNIALYILLAVLFTSCEEWDDDGADFKNYLRDKHPYSEIKDIDLNGLFSYQVNDTIRGQIWVYTSNRSEGSVRGVCVNCN